MPSHQTESYTIFSQFSFVFYSTYMPPTLFIVLMTKQSKNNAKKLFSFNKTSSNNRDKMAVLLLRKIA